MESVLGICHDGVFVESVLGICHDGVFVESVIMVFLWNLS